MYLNQLGVQANFLPVTGICSSSVPLKACTFPQQNLKELRKDRKTSRKDRNNPQKHRNVWR